MFQWLLRTEKDSAATLQRLFLGAVFFPHGAQKLLGIWGGAGLTGTLDFFAQMGIPTYLALLVIIFEFFGSIGLILGFLTRLWALGIAVIMAVAIATVHWPYGFFMNWFGTQSGEGFEYHLLAIALALGIVIRGAGCCSIDRRLSR